jgi:hypothetical protein
MVLGAIRSLAPAYCPLKEAVMNSFSKFALVSVLAVGASTAAFAAPDRILDYGDTVLPTTWTAQKTIAATPEILAFLSSQGVNGAIDASKGPVDPAAADALETVIASTLHKSDLLSILEPTLASNLAWGSVDSVDMRLGRHVFNLTERAAN